MPLVETDFQTAPFMANGHFQTLYPFFFRKVKEDRFRRKRIELQDGDFIDIDFLNNNSDELCVLTHGLEGNSSTGYMQGMAKHIADNLGQDIICWNMRSCSGELNRKTHFYHAASCEDLHEVIAFAKKHRPYKRVNIIGFSLGGNLTAYYASTYHQQRLSSIDSAMVFSSPIHLESSIKKLKESQIGVFYSESFLLTMRKKALEKQKLGLLDVDPDLIKACKDFTEFDELITAPTNGFKNALHYYEEASAINKIKETTVPLLIVQSKDDPFLTKQCFPMREAYRKDNLFLEITPSGGHIGFMRLDKKLNFWLEERAVKFLKEVS